MMKSKSNCLIIAGERSGEDHAMSFFPQLRDLCPEVDFFGVGGHRLEQLGVELIYHFKDFSGIGISEVLKKVPFYMRALNKILQLVDERQVKSAILIDFQGFNLKLAQKLKKRGVNVLYYVAPQAWVWKEYRVKTLEKTVHTLFTILPFEKKWFYSRGVHCVKSVSHPLLIKYQESIKKIPPRQFNKTSPKKVLLLPGSRRVEVENLLSTFYQAIEIVRDKGFDLKIGIVTVDSLPDIVYQSFNFDFKWDSEELEAAFVWADVAIASSGTVTLATGLFTLPTIVAYKLSLFTEFLMSYLLNYQGYVSLTNIILNKEVFPEFLQYRADRYNIAKALLSFLENEELYNQTLKDLELIREGLQGDDFSVPDYLSSVITDERK